MARIRIRKSPSAVPNQMSPNFSGKMLQLPSTSTARNLKAVPREDANIEAEKGETALIPNQNGLPAHFNIGGNRHTEGGTPLNVPKDTFIFSDTKKMRIKDPEILAEFGKAKGSWTPADLAKKYNLNKYRKILADPDSDKLDVNTAEKMMGNYELKLAKLGLIQESKKGFPQGIPAIAMPYLATFNIEPDSILPLKAEEQQSQQPQLPMGRYGMFLPRAQDGYDSQYVDPRGQKSVNSSDPNYGNMKFDPNQTTYFDTTQNTTGYTTGSNQGDMSAGNAYQVSKDSQFNPNDALYDNTQAYKQSQEQPNGQPSGKGSAFVGWRPEGEDAANWGIAAMQGAANLFNQPHNRRVQEQLNKRMKPESWMASRKDKDRGDYTTNYGYFRPDQQNVGNMTTGKYGGFFQEGGDFNPFSEADQSTDWYHSFMPKSDKPMVLSNDQVTLAAKKGIIPSNATKLDIQRIRKLNPTVGLTGDALKKAYNTLSPEVKKEIYHDLPREKKQQVSNPYSGYWDMAKHENVFNRASQEDVDPRMEESFKKLPFVRLAQDNPAGDWESLKELYLTPWKEINHLMTGKYEKTPETVKAYHKDLTSGQKLSLEATDPMLFPEIPYAVGKGLWKGAAKVVPPAAEFVAKKAQILAELTAKYGEKAAVYMVKQLSKLPFDKVMSWMGHLGSKGSQLAMHYEDTATPVSSFYRSPTQPDDYSDFRPYRNPNRSNAGSPMPGTPDNLQAAEDSTRRVVIKGMSQDTLKKKPTVDTTFFDTF